MSESGRRNCALGKHALPRSHQKITDPSMIKFLKKMKKDIASPVEVCDKCYTVFRQGYDIKMKRAAMLRSNMLKNASSVTSTSAFSSGSGSGSSRNNNNSLALALSPANVGRGDKGADNSNDRSYELVVPDTNHQVIPRPPALPVAVQSIQETERPTTSAMAAARARYAQQNGSLNSSSDDSDAPEPGINVLNGTRFPQYQPAPRRREFVATSQGVMDIYLSGVTGG